MAGYGIADPTDETPDRIDHHMVCQYRSRTDRVCARNALYRTDPAQTKPAEATFTTVHTTYVDSPLVAEQTYVYRVQAVGVNNTASDPSLYASATVLIDDAPPATPGNFVAVLASSGTAIELSWDAPIRDANGGALTGLAGFVIYRADSSNTVPTELTTVDADASKCIKIPTWQTARFTGIRSLPLTTRAMRVRDHPSRR